LFISIVLLVEGEYAGAFGFVNFRVERMMAIFRRRQRPGEQDVPVASQPLR
jgi:hypothetical protein